MSVVDGSANYDQFTELKIRRNLYEQPNNKLTFENFLI